MEGNTLLCPDGLVEDGKFVLPLSRLDFQLWVRQVVEMRRRQQAFQGKEFEAQSKFGGSLLKGNARGKRPLSTRLPLHVVVRTTKSSLRKPAVYRDVNLIVAGAARKYGLTLYKYANVGNHLHMLLKVPNRRLWPHFIREITGRIASLVQGLRGPQKGERFWLNKPFTRVVAGWGKAFKAVINYIYLNQMEGEGNIKRSEVASYREYRALFMDG